MKETINLKLKKYDYTDTVDMSTAHNPNMDIIDTEIKKLIDILGSGLEASNITIKDISNLFVALNVEEALIEVMTKAKGNETSISQIQNEIIGQTAKAISMHNRLDKVF